MMQKDTDDLQQELSRATSLNTFLAENAEHFSTDSVQALLHRTITKKGMTKAALARRSGISEIYLHQIFAGRRNPSRNRLICLCFGLSASPDEAQELLKQCGLAQLYPKNRRDAIILYGLAHSAELSEINDELFRAQEEPLF